MEKSELFDLCAYLAASAAGLKDEPKTYGPLRLLEVLGRFARLMASEYQDHFLERIADEIESKKGLQRENVEAFHDFLDKLVIEFVKERKSLMASSKGDADGTNRC